VFVVLSPYIAAEQKWRSLKLENLIGIKLDTGTVIINQAPFNATEHIAWFKDMVVEGFYNNEGFIA
jgi:peptidylprolyl isomerase